MAPELPGDKFFELFVIDELLKNYALSNDELDSGLVGNGGDGGIDGIFAFVNDILLTPDFDFKGIKGTPIIHLIIIQVKQSATYSETAVDKLVISSSDLLDLGRSITELSRRYNSQLVAVISDYHNAVKQLADQFPQFKFSYLW